MTVRGGVVGGGLSFMGKTCGKAPPALPAEVLRAALEQITESVAILDGSGRIVFWNEAATELLGYSADEAVGGLAEDLIVVSDGRRSITDLLASLTPLQPIVSEMTISGKSGRLLRVSVSAAVLSRPDGQSAHYLGISVSLRAQRLAVAAKGMLASIASSSLDSILVMDVDGVVSWANDASQDVFGWPPEEMIGRHVSVLTPEEGKTEQVARLAEALAGDDPVPPFVSTRMHRDGTRFQAAVTLATLRDDDGTVIGLSSTARDITEQQSTQRALRDSLELYRARFEQVPIPQALIDLEGRLLAVNDALCELLGYRRDDLVGRLIRSLLHPAHRDQNASAMTPMLAGEADAVTYELVGSTSEGRPVPVLVDAAVLRNNDRDVYAVALFLRDLSDFKESQQQLTSQARFFEALSRASSDVSVVVNADYQVTYVSSAVESLFGYAPEQVLNLAGWDFAHPDDIDTVRPIVEAVAAEHGRSERFTIRLRDEAGNWRWVEETVTNCLDHPDIAGLVVNLRDIGDQVKAERSLRESEARYRAIVATAQEGILLRDSAGKTLLANDKMAAIAGVTVEDLYQSKVLHILDRDIATRLGDRLSASDLNAPENYEVAYPHPDGEERIFSISASPLSTDDGELLGVLNMISDVTEARQTEQRLRWQALHDVLTGLPNRELLVDRLGMAVVRRERSSTAGVAVLFLDLDEFKPINDSRGHETGDMLLKETAARLELAVRATDTVARIGGDEFAVVCEDADEGVALEVAHRIRSSLSAQFDIGGEPLYVGVSIGVALYPPHPPSSLLRFADTAMYQAKSMGGNSVTVFDDTLAASSEQKLVLSNAVRGALNDGRMDLVYQPIFDLLSQEIHGYEALLTWHDPVLGDLPAGEIVKTANRSGLSLDLDRAVLRTACTEFLAMRVANVVPPGAYVAVNVSARALDKTLSDLVEDALAHSGLPARNLMLEITENTIMDNADRATKVLHELQEMGVSVAVDDFGTGYTSLAHLQRLPIDALKIDRAFIVEAKPGSIAIARSIVVLAHSIGVRTVAQGIETQQQAETMRSIGCDAGQGPLQPSASATAILTRQNNDE